MKTEEIQSQSSSMSTRACRTEVTWEARWFGQGRSPEWLIDDIRTVVTTSEVISSRPSLDDIHQQHAPGPLGGPDPSCSDSWCCDSWCCDRVAERTEERTDHYLIDDRSSNNDDFGLKIRDGRAFEVKERQGQRMSGLLDSQPVPLERWFKLSTDLERTGPPPSRSPHCWHPVRKDMWSIGLCVDPPRRVQLGERADASIQVVEVDAPEGKFWTLGIDAWCRSEPEYAGEPDDRVEHSHLASSSDAALATAEVLVGTMLFLLRRTSVFNASYPQLLQR